MREAVFLKLGMTHTSVGIGPGLEQFQAIRYDQKGAPIPFYDFDHPGASAIYASAHDLVRFGMFHLKDHLSDQSQILSDASIDAMHQPTMPLSDHAGYGIGWLSEDRPDSYHVVSHNGGMPGVSTNLVLVPSEDIAVVVLMNGEDYSSPITQEILKVLLPKWQTPEQKPGAPASPFTPDAALLGTWKGTLHTYQKDLPATVRILPSGDIHIQIADGLESLLNKVQFKDGWLSGEAWGDVETDDAERHRANTLLYTLKLRGSVLNGAVSATEDGSNPVALTEWLQVAKQP
jgi:CubicO group peptidase (beta-lactamase class C family)